MPSKAPVHGAAARMLQHKQAAAMHDQHRGSAAQRGYDKRWQRYSRRHLSAHPLCVRCQAQGRVTAATITDHIEPHRGDPVLFWDPSNHQPLCKPCHDHKTASEDGGFGRNC